MKPIATDTYNFERLMTDDSLDHDWKAYPVLHLDMGSMQAPTVAEELVEEL